MRDAWSVGMTAAGLESGNKMSLTDKSLNEGDHRGVRQTGTSQRKFLCNDYTMEYI